MLKRKAEAVWKGDLRSGQGSLSTASGALREMQYSFGTRFENGVGTNPEELIGAAHAGCFSMSLSVKLAEVGLKPDRIDTTATVTLDKTEAGFSVTAVHLDVAADVPGADPTVFEAAARSAKETCIISRLLRADISLTATLRSA